MNKQQFIKQRSKKYFWEQKGIESLIILGVIGLIIILPFLFMPLTAEVYNDPTFFDSSLFVQWFASLAIIILVLAILFMIGMIFFVAIIPLIQGWIISNQEKAKSRAEKDWEKMK